MGTWLAAALIAALALITLDPRRLGLSQTAGIAQLVGMRGLLACGLAALAALCVLVAARWHRTALARPAMTTAAVLAIIGLAHLGVLAGRGLGAGEPPSAADEQPEQVTVMAINALAGQADADAIVATVRSSGVDVLAVTEAAEWYRERLALRLAEAGLAFSMFTGETTGSPGRGSALFISADLGEYTGVATPYLGVVRIAPVDGVGPPIAVLHPRSLPALPIGPGAGAAMAAWRSDITVIEQVASQMPGGIIAGDFNATVDHLPLTDVAGYTDAATDAGIGGFATFPSWLPGWTGATLDHVLVDPAALAVDAAAVLDVPGSDHRAVLVRVAPV